MSGCEWVVDAYGCDAAALADRAALERLFDRLIADLELHPVAPPVWHSFPAPGGITGLCMLAESHLACHTFPEHGLVCLNVFCCRPRPEWNFAEGMAEAVGATRVRVRRLERLYEPDERVLPELRRTGQVSLV